MTIAPASRLEISGLESLLATGPQWLQTQRKNALEAFEGESFPTMKQETWRRTDPERFQVSAKKMANTTLVIEKSGAAETATGIHFAPILSCAAELEGKVSSVHTLAKANYFSKLNAAVYNTGVHLDVKKDSSTGEGMLVARHKFEGGGLAAPRSFVEIGSHSNVTVAEVFESDEQELLVNSVVEIHVHAGSRLRYMVVGNWGSQTAVVPTIHVKLEKDSYCQLVFVGTSGAITKCFVESDLVGEGCKSEVLGTVMGHGRQHYDIDAQQNHRVGSTVSDVLFHIALTDRARSIFGGNILCEPGAQKIDGYQQNRNMLLSDKARADSMPRLEIEANDVRCTHGASFSTYDADQRFYLQSRGLSASESEQLLVTGFFSEVLGRLEHDAAQEFLEKVMTDKLVSVLTGKR